MLSSLVGQADASSLPAAAPASAFLLNAPNNEGPVAVEISLVLYEINEIDDERETVEFNGVLISTWRDPRQAFDPTVAGTDEKLFQEIISSTKSHPAGSRRSY